MFAVDAISYAVIGLSHLYLIEKVLMHPQNRKKSITVQQATSRLFFEMYKYGPLRVVKENDHTDLVGRQSRLCCVSDPYLEAIDKMERSELVRETKNDANDSLFTLTDKGHLVAYLIKQRPRANDPCDCNDCEDSLDKVLWELKYARKLKLLTSDECEYPHLESDQMQMCLEDDSLLDALLRLERMGLVKLQEDLTFHLTTKGERSAEFTLSFFSKDRARVAHLN